MRSSPGYSAGDESESERLGNLINYTVLCNCVLSQYSYSLLTLFALETIPGHWGCARSDIAQNGVYTVGFDRAAEAIGSLGKDG